ncbi:MAG: hypothetical protein V1719_01210 [Patescibacteria group bacterium]
MKTKPTHKIPVKLVGLWIKLIMVSLVVVDVIANILRHNASLASDPVAPAATIDLTGSILAMFTGPNGANLGGLVGVLAVVVIVVAGIVYAFDLGGGKQSGLAKEMIISAISGVILFILAHWLITEMSDLFGTSPTSPGTGASPSPTIPAAPPVATGTPAPGTPPGGIPTQPGPPVMPGQWGGAGSGTPPGVSPPQI